VITQNSQIAKVWPEYWGDIARNDKALPVKLQAISID
jgi:hypothetical protein